MKLVLNKAFEIRDAKDLDLEPEALLENIYMFLKDPYMRQLTFKFHEGFESNVFFSLISCIKDAESLKFTEATGAEQTFELRFIKDYNLFLKTCRLYDKSKITLATVTRDEIQADVGYLIFLKGENVYGYN